MCLKHLTDREIQTYLDSDRTELVDRVEPHVEHCETCRAAMAQYTVLYTSIETRGGEAIKSSFADRVMTRIADEPLPELESERTFSRVLSIAGIPAGLAAVGATMHLTGTLSLTQGWLVGSLSYINTLVDTYVQSMTALEISPLLVIGSAGVALVGSQIDRLRKLVNRSHTLA